MTLLISRDRSTTTGNSLLSQIKLDLASISETQQPYVKMKKKELTQSTTVGE